jgi:Transposase DDE domain
LSASRDLHEDARDVARALAAAPQSVEACRRRKKIEMLFAHLKRLLRLTRLRLRGPNGASDEFLLAATAQNPRRLARPRPMNALSPAMAA